MTAAFAQAAAPAVEKKPGGPERKLLESDYFCLFLFGLLNPVVDSMRGLCAVSHLNRVQQDKRARPSWENATTALNTGFFEEMHQIGVSFVMRIRNKPCMVIIEELPLTDEDRAVGVTWRGMVKLGDKWQGEPVRVVKVAVDGKELLLATDLDIEAELIALIYQLPLADRVVFQMDEKHSGQPPLDGGIPREGGHPDLLLAHRGADVATLHRQTPEQACHGVDPLLYDGAGPFFK